MTPRLQAETFAAALLRHCEAVEVTVIRYIGTNREQTLGRPHRVRTLDDLGALWPWLRAENATRSANIYIRPCPASDHPWLFLDDLPTSRALAISRKYAALVVETSVGNTQIRLLVDRDLSTSERAEVQGHLARLVSADPGSTAGDKWGRLPGFTNRKLGKSGQWTNLLADTTESAPRYAPDLRASSPPPREGEGVVASPSPRRACTDGSDTDNSVLEFAYACHALRAGVDPDAVTAQIVARVAASGRKKNHDYAMRTVAAAMSKLRPSVSGGR
jgi:hypothetical protein